MLYPEIQTVRVSARSAGVIPGPSGSSCCFIAMLISQTPLSEEQSSENKMYPHLKH